MMAFEFSQHWSRTLRIETHKNYGWHPLLRVEPGQQFLGESREVQFHVARHLFERSRNRRKVLRFSA